MAHIQISESGRRTQVHYEEAPGNDICGEVLRRILREHHREAADERDCEQDRQRRLPVPVLVEDIAGWSGDGVGNRRENAVLINVTCHRGDLELSKVVGEGADSPYH